MIHDRRALYNILCVWSINIWDCRVFLNTWKITTPEYFYIFTAENICFVINNEFCRILLNFVEFCQLPRNMKQFVSGRPDLRSISSNNNLKGVLLCDCWAFMAYKLFSINIMIRRRKLNFHKFIKHWDLPAAKSNSEKVQIIKYQKTSSKYCNRSEAFGRAQIC